MLDERVHSLIQAGDGAGATQLIVETHGVEIFSYLMALTRDEDLASDAFAVTCESVLKAVLSFRAESSVRTWLYTLARHAAYRESRLERRRRGERISGLANVLQAPLRTATEVFRRTDVKDEFGKLRAALSAEERELLVLRIDRGLSWLEIASIQQGTNDVELIKREAARCRKRFERTKEKLRALAEKAGLLPSKA